MQPTEQAQEQTATEGTELQNADTSQQSNESDAGASPEAAEQDQSGLENKSAQAEPEVKPTEPVVQAEPLTPPVVKAAVQKKEEPVSDMQVMFDKIKEDGTPTEQALLKALDAYVNVLAPGKAVDPKLGAFHQHTLWQTLRFTVQSSPEGEFNRLWNIVLAFAQLHKDGAFHERYIMRFSEDWHYDLEELTAFQRLINLIKLTADHTKRQANLRQVDINRTLERGFNDHGRTRLISFYS